FTRARLLRRVCWRTAGRGGGDALSLKPRLGRSKAIEHVGTCDAFAVPAVGEDQAEQARDSQSDQGWRKTQHRAGIGPPGPPRGPRARGVVAGGFVGVTRTADYAGLPLVVRRV